jgi:hypothetical protein
MNLGEAKDKRCQLFEPGRRVLTSPGASLRFIKRRFRTSEKGFGQQPVERLLSFSRHNKYAPYGLGPGLRALSRGIMRPTIKANWAGGTPMKPSSRGNYYENKAL